MNERTKEQTNERTRLIIIPPGADNNSFSRATGYSMMPSSTRSSTVTKNHLTLYLVVHK